MTDNRSTTLFDVLADAGVSDELINTALCKFNFDDDLALDWILENKLPLEDEAASAGVIAEAAVAAPQSDSGNISNIISSICIDSKRKKHDDVDEKLAYLTVLLASCQPIIPVDVIKWSWEESQGNLDVALDTILSSRSSESITVAAVAVHNTAASNIANDGNNDKEVLQLLEDDFRRVSNVSASSTAGATSQKSTSSAIRNVGAGRSAGAMTPVPVRPVATSDVNYALERPLSYGELISLRECSGTSENNIIAILSGCPYVSQPLPSVGDGGDPSLFGSPGRTAFMSMLLDYVLACTCSDDEQVRYSVSPQNRLGTSYANVLKQPALVPLEVPSTPAALVAPLGHETLLDHWKIRTIPKYKVRHNQPHLSNKKDKSSDFVYDPPLEAPENHPVECIYCLISPSDPIGPSMSHKDSYSNVLNTDGNTPNNRLIGKQGVGSKQQNKKKRKEQKEKNRLHRNGRVSPVALSSDTAIRPDLVVHVDSTAITDVCSTVDEDLSDYSTEYSVAFLSSIFCDVCVEYVTHVFVCVEKGCFRSAMDHLLTLEIPDVAKVRSISKVHDTNGDTGQQNGRRNDVKVVQPTTQPLSYVNRMSLSYGRRPTPTSYGEAVVAANASEEPAQQKDCGNSTAGSSSHKQGKSWTKVTHHKHSPTVRGSHGGSTHTGNSNPADLALYWRTQANHLQQQYHRHAMRQSTLVSHGSYRRLVHQTLSQQSYNQYHSHVHNAQQHAFYYSVISRNSHVTMVFDKATNTYIFNGFSNPGGSKSPGGSVTRRYKLDFHGLQATETESLVHSLVTYYQSSPNRFYDDTAAPTGENGHSSGALVIDLIVGSGMHSKGGILRLGGVVEKVLMSNGVTSVCHGPVRTIRFG